MYIFQYITWNINHCSSFIQSACFLFRLLVIDKEEGTTTTSQNDRHICRREGAPPWFAPSLKIIHNLLWIRSNLNITLHTHNWFRLSSFIYFSVHWQKKQESKAPDKDAILKATANLSTRHSDRTVTQHNIRDVSKNSKFNWCWNTHFFFLCKAKKPLTVLFWFTDLFLWRNTGL